MQVNTPCLDTTDHMCILVQSRRSTKTMHIKGDPPGTQNLCILYSVYYCTNMLLFDFNLILNDYLHVCRHAN